MREAGDGATDVTLGGVQARPLRVEAPESAAQLAGLVERRVTEPWSDVLADGEYRRQVAGVVARRALEHLEAQPS